MALASWKKLNCTTKSQIDPLQTIWIAWIVIQSFEYFLCCISTQSISFGYRCSISCSRNFFLSVMQQGSNSEKKAQVLLPLIQRSQFLEQAQQRTASLRKATKAGGLWRRRSPLEPQAVPRYCFRRARRATAAVMCAAPTPWSTLRSYRDAPKNHRTVSAVKATEGPELIHLAYYNI